MASTLTITKPKKRSTPKEDEELPKKDKTPTVLEVPKKKKKTVTEKQAPPPPPPPPAQPASTTPAKPKKPKQTQPQVSTPPPPQPTLTKDEETESSEEDDDDEEEDDETKVVGSSEEEDDDEDEDDEDEEEEEEEDNEGTSKGENYATLTAPEPVKKPASTGTVHATISEPTTTNIKVTEPTLITFSCVGLHHTLVNVSTNRIFLRFYEKPRGKDGGFRLCIELQSPKKQTLKLLLCNPKFSPIQSVIATSNNPVGTLTPFKMYTSVLLPHLQMNSAGTNIDDTEYVVYMLWCFRISQPPAVRSFTWPGSQPKGWWSVIRENKILVSTGAPGDEIVNAQKGDMIYTVDEITPNSKSFFV